MENDSLNKTQNLEEFPFVKNALDNIANNLFSRYNNSITILIMFISCILLLCIFQTALIVKLLIKIQNQNQK